MNYLVKQNSGFLAVYYVGFIPENTDVIEATDEQINDLRNHKLMWNNGELVENENYEQYLLEKEAKKQRTLSKREIAELKQKLCDTDYLAIKYAEGLINEQDYQPIKTQRQQWRDRINELEKKL